MATALTARMALCFGQIVGVWRTTPRSFALATMLPLKVAAPMTMPNTPENWPTAEPWSPRAHQFDERRQERRDAAGPC